MELRKQKEKELHNIIRNKKLIASDNFEYYHSNKKWYSIARNSRNLVEKWLKEKCINKRVLDYCCGNGDKSLNIAKLGAGEVVGIDISDVSIDNGKKAAIREGLDKKIDFRVMDSEKMTFDNNSFDVVYESGVLHHLDLQKAYPEIARVLKPDGKCICIEALGYNPIIQYYREKTPHLRTKWETEHILYKKDIELAKKCFNSVEILGFFHLAAIAAVPFRNSLGFNVILSVLEGLDRMLLRLPILKWWAWQVVFVLSQPKK